MEYQLVIRKRSQTYWAFYLDAHKPPAYDFTGEHAVGKTIKEVLERARKFCPKDGPVLFTYLDTEGS